jgi:hypothetical protein
MKKISFFVVAALYSAMAIAQESANVDVNLKGDSGGGFNWMWIVGILVFIVLLVVLLNGRGRDKVVHKTIVKD